MVFKPYVCSWKNPRNLVIHGTSPHFHSQKKSQREIPVNATFLINYRWYVSTIFPGILTQDDPRVEGRWMKVDPYANHGAGIFTDQNWVILFG